MAAAVGEVADSLLESLSLAAMTSFSCSCPDGELGPGDIKFVLDNKFGFLLQDWSPVAAIHCWIFLSNFQCVNVSFAIILIFFVSNTFLILR